MAPRSTTGPVARDDHPYLYVEELDGRGLRAGAEVKPPEMWAGHTCDAPFRQWSLGNEARGVLLDDPTEAWRRAHGEVVPVAFMSSGTPPGTPLRSTTCRWARRDTGRRVKWTLAVELLEGVLVEGSASRVHVWGVPYVPRSLAMPIDHRGLRAPYRRRDGTLVDQVLTDAGWWVSV